MSSVTGTSVTTAPRSSSGRPTTTWRARSWSSGSAGRPPRCSPTTRRLTPLTGTDADKLIHSIRAAPLLPGYRGAPAADTRALCEVLPRVSRLADDLPEVTDLDLNPVIARSCANCGSGQDIRDRGLRAGQRDRLVTNDHRWIGRICSRVLHGDPGTMSRPG
jgi:ATP-grasp domain